MCASVHHLDEWNSHTFTFCFCWGKMSRSGLQSFERASNTFVSLVFLPSSSSSLRENILKTAKALVEDTKMLVSGAASGQDKLSQAAQSSAKTITQLTDVVKLGAASIGSDDPETQVSQSCFSSLCLSVYSPCLLSRE